MPAAKSGPLPPNANSAYSRGSRPRSLETARIDPHERAAAGPDLREIDRGHAQQIAGAGEQTRAVHDAAAHLVLGRAADLAVLDDRGLRRRAAHVERHELAEPDLLRERL